MRRTVLRYRCAPNFKVEDNAVTLDASGQSQIDFNPTICRRLGPDLCEYFRAHEYGHVNLRHLERGVPTRQAEREADIWAAQNASPSAVKAAREYFEKGKGGSRPRLPPRREPRFNILLDLERQSFVKLFRNERK